MASGSRPNRAAALSPIDALARLIAVESVTPMLADRARLAADAMEAWRSARAALTACEHEEAGSGLVGPRPEGWSSPWLGLKWEEFNCRQAATSNVLRVFLPKPVTLADCDLQDVFEPMYRELIGRPFFSKDATVLARRRAELIARQAA